jgi:DNA-binding transcriptional ArsR family regulator
VVIYNYMVVSQLADAQADRVFHALADSTRRDILVRALDGQHNVSALARNYSMSVTAVQKHVAVLERAGLVSKHRHGREQLVRGNADTMRRAVELLEKLEAAWRGRIDRIGDLLATDRNGGRKP